MPPKFDTHNKLMSLEDKKGITDRIWRHSQAANMGKLVLLALAESADPDGFCYPSQEAIGRMIGLGGKAETIQRNALHHLNPLIKGGELICWKQQGKRGGRGYTNIYLIAIGLTNEQIRERVKRRFNLFDDEVDAALSQEGETYKRLCTDRRISTEALKGVKIDGKQEEKPPKFDGLNPEKVVKSDPQLSQESEKGVNFGGGTKESLNPESKPNQESLKERGGLPPAPPAISPPIPKVERPGAIPGVTVFVEVTKRHVLNNTQIKEIDERVGRDPPALEKWRETVKAWQLAGNKINNVSGMLDWFRKGIPVYAQKASTNGTHRRHNQQPTGESLEGTETFDPNTGETVYPDGRREPAG